MLCKGETIGQWRDDVIHQHFRDHDTVERYQGTFGTIPYEFLRYRQKSGGSFGLVDYFLLGDTLTVRGDYGFAVYRAGWTDLGHIANSGYDYFCGKCEASEVGKRFKEWDPELAWRRMCHYFEDTDLSSVGMNEAVRVDDNQWIVPGDISIKLRKGEVGSKEEWNHWLERDGYEFFGNDILWDWSEIGMRVHLRCLLHLAGLKCALGLIDPKAGIDADTDADTNERRS
jgi:hypothetical protein